MNSVARQEQTPAGPDTGTSPVATSGDGLNSLLLLTFAFAMLPSLAMAQSTLTPYNSNWIPPEQYDKPYTEGPTIVVRGDEKLMPLMCPKVAAYPIPLGCHRVVTPAEAVSKQLNGPMLPKVCFIVIAKDNILEAQGWTYEQVKRHERGHCAGWPWNHPGARSLNKPLAQGNNM